MNEPLRIGIIGLGKIGRIHLDHLSAMPGVTVRSVADTVLPKGIVLPEGVSFVDDWRELVSDDGIDAVAICLPHFLHAPCASEALKHGKHVFLEKPVATTFAEARDLVALAEERRRLFMVNMTHRFYPPLLKARQLLSEGVIGKVISVRDYYMEIIDRREFPSWFFDPVAAGGGVALSDAIHLIDRVGWLLDEPLHFVGGAGRYMAPETAVEDCAEILCGSQSGIPVTIGSFFFTGPKTWEDGLTLFGTLGSMKVCAWSHVEWQRYGDAPNRWQGYAPESSPLSRSAVGHRAAVQEFVSAIREGRPPEAAAGTTLNAQRIVHEFYDFVAGKPSGDLPRDAPGLLA